MKRATRHNFATDRNQNVRLGSLAIRSKRVPDSERLERVENVSPTIRNKSYRLNGNLLLTLGLLLCACTDLEKTTQQTDGVEHAEEILSASVGDDPEQLGYVPGDESASEGPCSFAVDSDGRIYILDPVKDRIQVYKGDALEEDIPLPIDEAQDIRLLTNGDIAVLDAWTEGKLFVIDRKGLVKSVVPIEGIGLSKARLAGIMHVRPDGVWLEGRRRLVRVMDTQQQPDEKRPILSAGYLSKDGKWLIDYQISGISLTVVMRERDGIPRHRIRHVYFDNPIIGLIGSGFDNQGRLYIATLHDPGTQEGEGIISHLLVFSPELEIVRRTEISQVDNGPDNLFRNMEVTPEGHVYFLEMTSDNTGFKVRRYR